MDQLPSAWPFRYKLLAVVLFAGCMAVVIWFAKSLAYDWLPSWALGYVATGIVCGALGLIVGERMARSENL